MPLAQQIHVVEGIIARNLNFERVKHPHPWGGLQGMYLIFSLQGLGWA